MRAYTEPGPAQKKPLTNIVSPLALAPSQYAQLSSQPCLLVVNSPTSGWLLTLPDQHLIPSHHMVQLRARGFHTQPTSVPPWAPHAFGSSPFELELSGSALPHHKVNPRASALSGSLGVPYPT